MDVDELKSCPVCGKVRSPRWAAVVGTVLITAVAWVVVLAAVWACVKIGRAI